MRASHFRNWVLACSVVDIAWRLLLEERPLRGTKECLVRQRYIFWKVRATLIVIFSQVMDSEMGSK